MKYFITGSEGQLGYDLIKELKKRNITDIYAPGMAELDITNEEQVKEKITNYHPDVIFHCAAYTAVDKAEENRDICYNVNVKGTKYIASVASSIDAKMIYISSDYVFDGSILDKWEVTNQPNPINYYGETKYLGEEEVKKCPKHFIVRTSWVYGINGKNFIRTMLTLAETKKEISVVSDQIGSPTYTVDLAKLLVDMSLTDKYGIYHCTNENFCSWNELARYVFKINNLDVSVPEVLTKDYKSAAKRPLNSRLSKKSLTENGFSLLPTWEDAVLRYNQELKENK